MNPTDVIIRMICRAASAIVWTVIATGLWVAFVLDDLSPTASTWDSFLYLVRAVSTVFATVVALRHMREITGIAQTLDRQYTYIFKDAEETGER